MKNEIVVLVIFFVELHKGSSQVYSEALLTTNIVPMYQSFQGKNFNLTNTFGGKRM